MLVETTVLFLAGSLVLYAVLAGADFGAGIIGLFLGRSADAREEQLINGALGPVWEANHVWIIAALVITFTGFPEAFAAVTTYFHVPLTVMLIGIVFRGCAFTFRNYDVRRDRSHDYYTQAFGVSSFLAPLMFGLIAGGLMRGVPEVQTHSFIEVYVTPWFNLFSLSLGLFACTICAFLASVYLIGETGDSRLRERLTGRARRSLILAALFAVTVLVLGEFSGLGLLSRFIADPLTAACLAAAVLLVLPLWLSMARGGLLPRMLAAGQGALILAGWFRLEYPRIMNVGAREITFYNTQAPEVTLRLLVWTLAFGMALVLPSLFYLFKTFKRVPADRPAG